MSWFGNLQLAYKFSIVFGVLLVLTILAGFVKVLYNRRRLNKFVQAAKTNVESGSNDDEQVELNQREKDEGDLFGVRAIEAGFYAGIPQSRPTSRAGSRAGSYVDGPSMSSSTLVGSLGPPKQNTNSMASSVMSLPRAHTPTGNRGSDLGPDSPPRRKGTPTITLRPSEAQMNGSTSHNVAVNMSLSVPPSPVLARQPRSPSSNGSDSDSDNGRLSPTGNYAQDHYSSLPPQLPMPDLLRVSVHSPEGIYKSQAASFDDPSPGHSAPPSPGLPPTSKLPSVPQIHYDEPPSSSVLQPQTYQPTHQRDISNASSVYSENRMSAIKLQRNRSDSEESSFSYNLFPEASNRISVIGPSNMTESSNQRKSSFLDPNSATSSSQSNDPRFSEFYDSYYRQSQLGLPSKTDAPKRSNQLNLSETINEVPSPLPSPAVEAHHYPGSAM